VTRDDFAIETPTGRIAVTGAALSTHVVRAAETVAGVRVRRPRRGLKIVIGDGGVHVDVRLNVVAGAQLPVVGDDVQQAISAALGRATGQTVTVDVVIEEIDP
jgi:uncharacterized alkaline shock family protein YloU